jgi:hypothetical protein
MRTILYTATTQPNPEKARQQNVLKEVAAIVAKLPKGAIKFGVAVIIPNDEVKKKS